MSSGNICVDRAQPETGDLNYLLSANSVHHSLPLEFSRECGSVSHSLTELFFIEGRIECSFVFRIISIYSPWLKENS
jgi:hypothetical protein